MLPPAQVIPFLEHEDWKVRNEAARYLANAHDPAPATAEDFWRAIDRFGLKERILTASLALLPQTEQSYVRLMAALRSLDQGKARKTVRDRLIAEDLWDALHSLDWDLLLKHRDEVLAFGKTPSETHRHLKRRLALQKVPLD